MYRILSILIFSFTPRRHPTHPLPRFRRRVSLTRPGKGPLGRRGGGVHGCLAHGVARQNSGGELGLGLLEAGARLPVERVDLRRRTGENSVTGLPPYLPCKSEVFNTGV